MTPENKIKWQRVAEFSRETRGMSAWNIAKAMNHLTPGIDYRGCNKSQLQETFASDPSGYGMKKKTGADLRAAIAKIKGRA